MPLISVPKWPVVDPSPTMGKALMNFNVKDYGMVVGGGISGYAFGFYGAQKALRIPNARFLALIGVSFGVCYGSLSSIQRFIGLEPNDYEVRTYGAMSKEGLEDSYRKHNVPNFELIDSSETKK
mmetsp:Transcript_33/g.41  ORF Transcript_33/g.41 Transcript_33/m.41 type:complete len:124 (+) Transcript_33:40-411(+)